MAPPIAGPTLRAMLKFMLLSATAPASSERGTMSPTDACHAGPLNAPPHPIKNVSDSSSHGVKSPVHAHTESVSDMISMKLCAASMTLRRSRLSAIAPEISDNNMVGSVMDACTSATISADCAIESIIHDAPTDWIIPPRLDTTLANHTARKMGKRNGDSADTCGAPLRSGSVGASKELWRSIGRAFKCKAVHASIGACAAY